MGKLLDLDGLLAKASENKEEKSRNQEILIYLKKQYLEQNVPL